jgi:hypothetical protein
MQICELGDERQEYGSLHTRLSPVIWQSPHPPHTAWQVDSLFVLHPPSGLMGWHVNGTLQSLSLVQG